MDPRYSGGARQVHVLINGGSELPECVGDSTQEEWSISVDQGLAVEQSSLPSGMVNKPYSTKLTAAGGGSQTWSATNLRAGLAIAADGTISGTPTTTGGQAVRVTVKDANRSTSKDLTIAIRNQIDIAAVTVPVQGINRLFSQVVRASGGNEVYTWALEGQVPPGLQIAPAPTDKFAAIISGTPTRAARTP